MIPIRKAKESDARAVWDIRNVAINSQCKGHYPPELLEIWTTGEMTEQFVLAVVEQFYVATVHDVVVGAGAVDLDRGQLDAVFVRPDMMRRGVGSQIVAYLESLAREAGLTRLTLDSTLNAAGFYRRCGYVGEAVGSYQSPCGISLECIPMAKWLALPAGESQ